MTCVSRIALGAALVFGPCFLASAKQPVAPGAVATVGGRSFALSPAFRAALAPLVSALDARDYNGAIVALPGAQAAATNGDERYIVGAEQMRLGLETNNSAIQSAAIGTIIDSGRADPAQLAELYRDRASLALSTGDSKAAESALSRVADLTPNDPDVLAALAQLRVLQKKNASVVDLIDRAIDLKAASGQPISEAWYKYGLNFSELAAMPTRTLKFGRELITAYPSARNWRDVILTYRDLTKPEPATELDAYRLIRLNKALSGERDYMAMAAMLDRAGDAGEAKALLDEGVAANMLDPAKADVKQLRVKLATRAAAERKALATQERNAATAPAGAPALAAADTYLGTGDYAKAAALYRTALQKGSVDPNLVNMRLGMALAQSGQKADAETAFRAVSGPRAELANLYLIWLSKRA